MTTAVTGEAEQCVQAAAALRSGVERGGWPAGLRAGGSLQALDATMQPIDRLPAAGLDWLVPHVQPLQTVVDQLAGRSTVVQSFADAWQRTSGTVGEVRDQLARAVRTDIADWHGEAADRYRVRANELITSLAAAADTAAAMSSLSRQFGEVVADARQQAGDLLADLVTRLISYTRQAMAVEGGLTPNVMAQATGMINSYRGPILEVDGRLRQVVDTIPASLTGEDILEIILNLIPLVRVLRVIRAILRWLRRIFRGRGRGEPREPPGPQEPPLPPADVTEAAMIRAIRNSPKVRIGQVDPPANWPPTTHDGNVMQTRVEQVVRQRWRDTQFDSTGLGQHGPDMRVRQGRNPGFDWAEIKPDTESGISTFVRREWGQNPNWSGHGRLITYDAQGNVYEIQFPLRTAP